MTYSLIEPIMDAGLKVTGVEGLTGLAEYRNGGLILDSGLISFATARGCGQKVAARFGFDYRVARFDDLLFGPHRSGSAKIYRQNGRRISTRKSFRGRHLVGGAIFGQRKTSKPVSRRSIS